MELKLPSADSVVNFLNAGGKDSSYGARKKLYASMGLDKRLGDYVGGDAQNRGLLGALQQPAQKPIQNAPNYAGNILSALKPSGGGNALETLRASQTQTQPKMPGSNLLASAGASIKSALTPFGGLTPSKVTTPSAPSDMSWVGDIHKQVFGTPTAPKQYATPSGTNVMVDSGGNAAGGNGDDDDTTSAEYDMQTKENGFSASDIVSDFNASESDLINDYLTSEDGQILMERVRLGQMNAEAAQAEAKAALDAKYASDFAKVENSLAANGLAFSGIRTTQLKALADNLASSELGVDREFASKLLDADLDLREGILKGVEELVKDAQAKDKEAIQQLNAVGLAVINGQLVPTLSAQSAARADRQLEMSERRLELSEAASARAEALFHKSFAAMNAAERRAAATVELYRADVITPILQSGLPPQQALAAANQAASLSGIVLDAEQQAAVLAEANRLLSSGEVKPTPQTVDAPEKGFFARMWGN